MRQRTRPWALAALLALIVAACGGNTAATTTAAAPISTAGPATTEAPGTTAPPATDTTVGSSTTVGEGGAGFKACQVTDTGGVDDKGFNQTAYKGVQDAVAELGIEGKVLESQAETDYATNINAFVEEECDVIVTVGFLLGAATQEAANANPDLPFSIVDFAYGDNEDGTPAIENNNVLGQVFSIEQATFLGGYLAAGMTQTGVVGTFGGINIPPVTAFMDGFVQGVAYYNEQNGTEVVVVGWDQAAQDGLFTNNFDSTDDGRSFAQNLVDEGADIVMPVAGPVGLGSSALATELGAETLKIIGVDLDQFLSNSADGPVYLTSILKNMDITTFNAIQAVVDGTFEGGVTVGTLENGGVGLAPYHDFESAVPAELATAIEDIKAMIISGDIVVTTGATG